MAALKDTQSVLKPLTDTQALFNTRVKYFGEDFSKITCFSRPIFNPYKMELHKREKPVTAPLQTDYSGCDIPDKYKKQPSKQIERKDSLNRAKNKVFEIA